MGVIKDGHILLRKRSMRHIVYFDNVIYAKALGRYTEIVSEDEKYIVCKNLKEIYFELPNHLFIRIHRSYVINIKKIRMFDNKRVNLSNDTWLPISSRMYKDVLGVLS